MKKLLKTISIIFLVTCMLFITSCEKQYKVTFKDYDGTILKENIQHLIITKCHPAGFIEYSYKGPEIEGSSGNYSIYRAEILDKPDELLLKYFPELKE